MAFSENMRIITSIIAISFPLYLPLTIP